MLVASNDAVCTPEQARKVAAALGDNLALITMYENADHTFFSWSN